MRQRCNNPKDAYFADYGGRGITVCDRWASFENFLADMGICPPGLTIERKNNDGNYEPDNCCWATYFEQGRNKRNTRWVTHAGETLTLAEWSRKLGVEASTLRRNWIRQGVIQL
jgi:hypothetical protein